MNMNMNQYIARPASIPSQRDARALLVVPAIGARPRWSAASPRSLSLAWLVR
jgi:hypothetical protein